MQTKKQKLLKLISIKVILVSLLFVASLFVFAFIANEAVVENEKGFDNKAFAFFSSFSTPGLIKVMEVVTFFGSSWFLFPAYIILVAYFFIQRKYRYAIDIAILASSSEILVQALKLIFHRQRPDVPFISHIITHSFPSGHTMSAFIFCSILIYIIYYGKWNLLYKWFISTLLILFSLSIGVSRIILRAHYATDVVASICLGIVWTILSLWILRFFNKKYK